LRAVDRRRYERELINARKQSGELQTALEERLRQERENAELRNGSSLFSATIFATRSRRGGRDSPRIDDAEQRRPYGEPIRQEPTTNWKRSATSVSAVRQPIRLATIPLSGLS
jgi:hypothetical protein